METFASYRSLTGSDILLFSLSLTLYTVHGSKTHLAKFSKLNPLLFTPEEGEVLVCGPNDCTFTNTSQLLGKVVDG